VCKKGMECKVHTRVVGMVGGTASMSSSASSLETTKFSIGTEHIGFILGRCQFVERTFQERTRIYARKFASRPLTLSPSRPLALSPSRPLALSPSRPLTSQGWGKVQATPDQLPR
jgi:hypothetical protein